MVTLENGVWPIDLYLFNLYGLSYRDIMYLFYLDAEENSDPDIIVLLFLFHQ